MVGPLELLPGPALTATLDFLVDDTNTLQVLRTLGSTNSRMARLLASLFDTNAYTRLRACYIESARKEVLQCLYQSMLESNASHPLFRRLRDSRIRFHEYLVNRWLLYERLPVSSRYAVQQLRIDRGYSLPFPGPAFWFSESVAERVDSLGASPDRVSMRLYYMTRLIEKCPQAARKITAWHNSFPAGDIVKSMMSPVCALCLRRSLPLVSDFCYVCDGVHDNNYRQIDSTFVLVCSDCRAGKEVSEVEYHCCFGDYECAGYSHAGQGCYCLCHSSQEWM